MDVDDLANEIRMVPGWRDLGAGELAEQLLPAILREAASRLQAPAVAEVEVKPMEWGSYGADTPFGSYTVSENFDDKWEWTFHCYPYGSPDDTVYDTEAEARQAAQADYERRIRSALRTGGSE